MKVNLIIILSLCLLANIFQSEESEDFSCQISKLDDNLAKLIGYFGVHDVKWETSFQEMRQMCRLLTERSEEANDIANSCLSGLSSTISSVTTLKATRVNRQFCRNRKEMKKRIEHAKCINQAKNETAKCWQTTINVLFNLKNSNSSEGKIPGICCQFYEWKDCTIDSIRNMSSKICSQSDVDFVDDLIVKTSLDPLNILCDDYDDESDKCDKVRPLLDRRPADSPYRTFFPALFDVFDSI